jgi:amino acid adenylation domain-containing protein/non-ribosomal peptide synthase protein (TIGR01720 family)
VIYTSGSTGLPKGVMVEHRSVVNFIQFCIDAYQITPQDRVLQFATINFDTAVEEIFSTLIAGAALVLRNDEVLLSGEELLAMVEEHGLTVLDLPTAYWHEWVYGLLITEKKVPEGVRLVIVGGEKCLIERYENWLQVGGSPGNWVNTYGPTEATVVSSLYWPTTDEMAHYSEVPIGRPISNGKLYVLDSNHLPVPVGVSGELCIGGAGVARGYLNASNKTAEVFVPDPYSGIPGARLYRTGDLVRYLPDGNIEFIGRVDYQVKIRGFRVELGEIDTVLTRNENVREAVTVAISSGSDHLRLVSYVVPLHSGEQSVSDQYKKELREYLKDYLPEYMVPFAIVLLEELPISPSGKINRRALPEPEIESVEVETAFVAPRTPDEETLTKVWSEVLGIERIGVHDNFFELGGDSILSIQVIARSSMAGLKLLPRNLFENPTISGLALVAEKGVKIEAEQGLVVGDVILTPIQSWYFKQNLPNPNHYNQALMMKVNQPLKVGYLEEVVRALVAHHDALRLRFSSDADFWQQCDAGLAEVLESADHLVHVDLSMSADEDVSNRIEQLAEEFQAGLDITNGPIFRVIFFDLGDKRPARLLIVAHHLAMDGISWRILLEDFQTAYIQVSSGEEIKLPPKSTSFQLWADRLAAYAQTEAANAELAYWEMVSAKTVRKIPVDYAGGDNIEKFQRGVSVWLNEDETQALLKEVPSAYQTEINDVLLTALAQVVRMWTGGNSMLIEMEGHGREYLFEDVDVSRTVGWFTSIYPVLIELSGKETIGDALKSVKEQLRTLPNHGIGYGLLRYMVKDEGIRRSMSALPHLELSFNYLGQFDQALPEDGIFGIAKESRGRDRDAAGTRGALLDINGGILRGQLTMEWSYSVNIHRRETIERLANEYIEALRNIIKHCQVPESEGFTPSDFPMASIDQKELDKLLGKIQ